VVWCAKVGDKLNCSKYFTNGYLNKHDLMNVFNTNSIKSFLCVNRKLLRSLKLRPFLILFLGLVVQNLYAQENLYPEIESLGDYSPGSFRVIFNGDDGLWVGANAGLFKIVGKHVQLFNDSNSPIKSRVNGIYEDKDRNLWISTNKNGVVLYNRYDDEFTQYSYNEGLTSERCDFFAPLAYQVFITCNKGLYSIDIKTKVIQHHIRDKGLFDDYITAFNMIVSDEKGIWFVGDDKRLHRYDPNTQRTETIDTGNVIFNGSVAMYLDSLGRLWICVDQKVYQLETLKNGFEFHEVEVNASNINIDSITEDTNGVLWFGGSTLLVYDEVEKKIEFSNAFKPLFQKDLIAGGAIIFDLSFGKNDGELYVLTSRGIMALSNTRNIVQYISFIGEPKNYINDAYAFSEDLSIINIRSGLYTLDAKQVILSTEEGLTPISRVGINIAAIDRLNSETAIYVDWSNRVYLLDMSSLEVTEIDILKLGLPKELLEEDTKTIIQSMLVGNNGEIFISVIGEGQGVYKGTISEGFVNVLPGAKVYHMLRGQSGNAYIAILHEGIREYTVDGSWRLWESKEGVTFSYSHCLLKDKQGKVWVCDDDNGLGYLDIESQSIKYVPPEIISGARKLESGVMDDEGFIWATSSVGLVRYDTRNNVSIVIGSSEGINEPTRLNRGAFNLTKSLLVFSSPNTDYVIDSKLMNEVLDERASKITQALIVGYDVSKKNSSETRSTQFSNDITKELVASYDDFLFTFRFAVNHFLERNNFEFEYRLRGLNEGWLKAKQNTATFSTLPPGEYVLEVRAVDSKSHMEQPVNELPIKVLPPYWLTAQAYVIYMLTLVAFFYAIYHYRTRQLTLVNIQLEEAVATRTAELTERTTELSKSHSQISSLLTQKESLFANVSHEFRTPLTLILGPMSELQSKLSDTGDIQKFDMMHRNTKRLVQLVEQVLELARLDTAVELPKQVYIIDNALSILVNSFKPLAELKRQKLVVFNHCSGGLELTKDALEKILYNLLSNAIKYSPEGGTITVVGEQVDNQYCISVRDTGAGIPEDELEIIFERFTRLEKTSEQLGSGLGLAVVRELVKTNDGTIEVFSKLEEGTTFTVTLPLLSDFDVSQAHIISDTLLTLESATELAASKYIPLPDKLSVDSEVDTKPTLLIIEDNLDMQSYIFQSLEADYHCITADNGQQGIDMAVEYVPDLILSDLMMPLKDGFEVVDSLRENDLTAHIPITLLTAKGDDESRLTGWQKAVDDYIAKPFNTEELKLRLSRLLSVRDIVKRRITKQLSQQVTRIEAHDGEAEKTEQDQGLPKFNSKRDEKFYTKLMQVIEDNYTNSEFGRGQAAEALAVSERQLNRKLSAIVEFNFAELVRKRRLDKAKALLLEGHQIGEVAYDVGFTSPSYFSRCFKAEFDMAPKNLSIAD
jgi:signal transduction histidine kinase/DNA-binding response OmpR family regulator/ligand-binding sensor domain-containing protein